MQSFQGLCRSSVWVVHGLYRCLSGLHKGCSVFWVFVVFWLFLDFLREIPDSGIKGVLNFRVKGLSQLGA